MVIRIGKNLTPTIQLEEPGSSDGGIGVSLTTPLRPNDFQSYPWQRLGSNNYTRTGQACQCSDINVLNGALLITCSDSTPSAWNQGVFRSAETIFVVANVKVGVEHERQHHLSM